MSYTLLYDTYEFHTFDIMLEKDEQPKKTQVILYIIHDLKHKPILSFCLEDVLSCEPNKIYEQSEIYLPQLQINRDGLLINVQLEIPQYIASNRLLEPAQYYNLVFDCQQKLFNNIKKSKFNNFEYIEKQITDVVDDHQDKLEQLIEQVKRISEHLSS